MPDYLVASGLDRVVTVGSPRPNQVGLGGSTVGKGLAIALSRNDRGNCFEFRQFEFWPGSFEPFVMFVPVPRQTHGLAVVLRGY